MPSKTGFVGHSLACAELSVAHLRDLKLQASNVDAHAQLTCVTIAAPPCHIVQTFFVPPCQLSERGAGRPRLAQPLSVEGARSRLPRLQRATRIAGVHSLLANLESTVTRAKALRSSRLPWCCTRSIRHGNVSRPNRGACLRANVRTHLHALQRRHTSWQGCD